jgi:hypothetical protein
LVQTEGKVEALRVVVATSIFNGESIASELEFLWEKQIAKSSREGGEAVVLACHVGFLASNFYNSAAGVIATA